MPADDVAANAATTSVRIMSFHAGEFIHDHPFRSRGIYCVKCKVKTDSRDIEAVTMKNGRPNALRLREVRHQ